MSYLISLEQVSLAFGLDVLLDQAKLQVAPRERVCLIGRNGAGKSSLLKIIEGSLLPDSGIVYRKPSLKIARLTQELPKDTQHTVFEYVAEGLSGMGQLLADYHRLTHRLTEAHTQDDLNELERLQHLIDIENGWQYEQEINNTLTRLSLNPDVKVADLSGGFQRRVALAKALVVSPELLLLDEPTNHLDMDAIQWLEDELVSLPVGLIFITHDRSLLQRLATRIIELDRGQLTSWPGDYANFLLRKEERLQTEEKQNALFDKKLAQEEKWIRQGIKARRTRNEGRVRALEALRKKRSLRKEVLGTVNFTVNKADSSGQRVIEAKNITHFYHDQCIINNFSICITRQDRIGLIGPNGIGKTTLLNILLGKINPTQGEVKQGTRLEVGYFDQLREALNPAQSVAENITQGNEYLEINGQKKHIVSYLSDFLFTPARALTPVKALSGGECNRLLLARLFSKPSNVLVMDEPTNDLDLETLELLEERLAQYEGTILLVSHDRKFIDNVATSTLVFEGNGEIKEYVGGYEDWVAQKAILQANTQSPQPVVNKKPSRAIVRGNQQALNGLLKKIENLENEQKNVEHLIGLPEFYQKDSKEIAMTLEKLKKITLEIAQAYQQWEELMKSEPG